MDRKHRRRQRLVALGATILATALMPVAVADARLGDRTLRLGMHGSDVSELQGNLDAAGYTIVATGRFAASTRTRVRQFQTDHGLRIDGSVDRADARAIRAAAAAPPASGGSSADNPSQPGAPPTVPGAKARLLASGLAAAPASAPYEVKAIIAQGNKIARLPYKWGGGHASWNDTGYDCSGSLTFALRTTFRRGAFPTFGYSNWKEAGVGRWITTYANSGHVYMVVAGLRFDSSGVRQTGSRWQTQMRDGSGFVARHPAGF